MGRRLLVLFLVLAAGALAPAAGQARERLLPLLDEPPATTYFKDAVLGSSGPRAHAASDTANFNAFPTPDGPSIGVAISSAYVAPDPSVAQTYVDFLDSLPHSTELAKLHVYIAPPAEVLSDCGGGEGTLACYDPSSSIMVVPGEQMAPVHGITTSYVIAHEYGHHIAANRPNDPFGAFSYGPKYWSSYELVCDRTSKHELFPGDEDAKYAANPGELWAETYAHMKYHDVSWTFSALAKPDAGAFAAAAKDVTDPWQQNRVRVFRGSFGAGGASTRRFRFDLTLDGAMSFRLSGPGRSDYNVIVDSSAGGGGRTRARGSHDVLSYTSACRTQRVEHVTVTVVRRRGAGPFSLQASYAG